MKRKQDLYTFLKETNLDNSFLTGFYGGGNYGDELLLEVLANIFEAKKSQNVKVSYFNISNYPTMHREFKGVKLVEGTDRAQVLIGMLTSRNIIIGGGGLWGLDVNKNILLLSTLLFVLRYVFFKKVYLLGVGYYNSTPKLGHRSAYLASKAANKIFARDDESYKNFIKYKKSTIRDKDISAYMNHIDLTRYKRVNKIIPQSTEVLIFLRRMKKSKQDNYNNSVEKLIQQNPEKKFTVAILESAKEDAHNDALIRSWAKKFNNVTTFSPIFNPLELYSEFMEGASYCVVAPQYHVIITAHAAGISFMPIVYDNKVRQVLQEINPTVEPYSIETLKTEDIQLFIDQEHKRVI